MADFTEVRDLNTGQLLGVWRCEPPIADRMRMYNGREWITRNMMDFVYAPPGSEIIIIRCLLVDGLTEAQLLWSFEAI